MLNLYSKGNNFFHEFGKSRFFRHFQKKAAYA